MADCGTFSARPGQARRAQEPAFSDDAKIGGQSVGLLREPDHHGGILIRSTRSLPAQYRIEYSLVAIDFGGSRHGLWNIRSDLTATRKRRPKHATRGRSVRAMNFQTLCDWLDVRFANGFYFLGIVDYPNPFPRNNVFIHTHRKVVMDSYNVNERRLLKRATPWKKNTTLARTTP